MQWASTSRQIGTRHVETSIVSYRTTYEQLKTNRSNFEVIFVSAAEDLMPNHPSAQQQEEQILHDRVELVHRYGVKAFQG
ncbi:hypothetical protein NL676_025225 [Syzygium grande]|nr:hypothetical protein NL676_025225 [Syzygium grande]